VDYSWTVTTPAASPNNRPVTVEMARTQCRVPDESQDEYLALLIDAATEYVQTNGRLILCPQTIRVQWAYFPCQNAFLNLPLGPVRGSVTLEYAEATAGAWTAYTPQSWTDTIPPRLAPDRDENWPPTQSLTVPAVRATYAAGYATVSAIPPSLRNAVLMIVRMNYESPDGWSKGGDLKIPDLVQQMIGAASRRGYP
jgi:uncharacterized phiE125 gp8 family phage protein